MKSRSLAQRTRQRRLDYSSTDGHESLALAIGRAAHAKGHVAQAAGAGRATQPRDASSSPGGVGVRTRQPSAPGPVSLSCEDGCPFCQCPETD